MHLLKTLMPGGGGGEPSGGGGSGAEPLLNGDGIEPAQTLEEIQLKSPTSNSPKEVGYGYALELLLVVLVVAFITYLLRRKRD
jgi:hypothetical protein